MERPLTENMRNTLRLISEGRNTQRDLTQGQRNGAHELNERGLILWHHDGAKYIWLVTELGHIELARMRGEVE